MLMCVSFIRQTYRTSTPK